jgi:NADH-quinone oxidoreductase subunit C
LPRGPRQLEGSAVAARLREALPDVVTAETDEWVEIEPARVVDAMRWLHDDADLDAAQLSNLCAVDRYDHFEVVYHLQSLDQNHQIVVKTRVGEHEDASLPSVYPVYKGALLLEREVYDLMGIRFEGHPDLRRMFLWEGYPAFPLRKDFLQIEGHHPGLPRFPFEQSGKQDR